MIDQFVEKGSGMKKAEGDIDSSNGKAGKSMMSTFSPSEVGARAGVIRSGSIACYELTAASLAAQ